MTFFDMLTTTLRRFHRGTARDERRADAEAATALADALLPQPDFSECHQLARLRATPAALMQAIKAYDDRQDPVLNALLTLRELPARAARAWGGRNALSGRGRFGFKDFTLLAETPTVIAYGLLGRFWRLDYGLLPLAHAQQFVAPSASGVAKLVMTFSVHPVAAEGICTLCTETRIGCPDRRTYLLMLPYWLAIRLASGWIRRRILRQIRATVEAGG